MRVNHLNLIESGGLALAAAAQAASPQGPALCLSVSCVGRRLVLGEHTEEELELLSQWLPPGSAQVGFYSYGEIAPIHGFQACDLHNQTMGLTTIRE